jgi:hypothetical protein
MAAQIFVQSAGENRFQIVVREGGSETRHIVTVEPDYAAKLAGPGVSPEELLRRSFKFLLERESKESILRQFHLREIGRYFPDYEAEIRG